MNLLRGVGCCGTDIDRLALNKLLEETGDDSMFQKEQLTKVAKLFLCSTGYERGFIPELIV